MGQVQARTFEDRPAVRERVPLLVGLMGPSGGGKTYSALRLAEGIQSVSGGDIFVVDTEARRALHYADRFKFRHVEFGAPFNPLSYLAAIEHCVKKGAGVVIVDSTSHEHEGPGGVLEMHDAEVQRMAKGDYAKAERVKMLAWQKPKIERRRLINSVLQMPCNFIFCFRAKDKIKPAKGGGEPQHLGFMPIAGEEFVFEMMVNCLLLPGAGGVPTWTSNEVGEKKMIKLPEFARSMFTNGQPLNEQAGEALARWAAGTVARTAPDLLAAYAACSTPAALGALEIDRAAMWKSTSDDQKRALKKASADATERVRRATAEPAHDPSSGEVAPEDEPRA